MVFAFYSDDSSSNPAKANSNYSAKIVSGQYNSLESHDLK